MYKVLGFCLFFAGLISISHADEGMWIPMLLGELNEADMQEMGMRISAEDIYSVNQSSLKDAIVLFGRGCTAEIISGEGLLLTNHHCGYGQIQKHSSLDDDYLTEGFWAMDRSEELPNPGLSVTMLMEMKDVTDQMIQGLGENLTEEQRNIFLQNRRDSLIQLIEDSSNYQATIKSFYHGNQFYVLLTQKFEDIRLVGAPPSNIGKFGGDTDNWMWPRHTGDFSLFRIYVAPDGSPAPFAEENVPYKPRLHLPISLKGVQKDDFTFVFGYPARTNEYAPSYEIEQITELRNPAKIALRQARLNVFTQYTDHDPALRLKYAYKHARVSNYWKKMIGESRGIQRMKGIQMKKAEEEAFQQWVNADAELQARFGQLISSFQVLYKQMNQLLLARDYMYEGGFGIESVSFASKFSQLIEESEKKKPDQDKINEWVEKLKTTTQMHFKDYYRPIDQDVMEQLLELYQQGAPDIYQPGFLKTIQDTYQGDAAAYTNQVFEKSVFASEAKIMKILDDFKPGKSKKLSKDPVYKMAQDLSSALNDGIKPELAVLETKLDSLQRLYMKALMEWQPEKRFYPDANFTLRVAYGKVDGYEPRDAVTYKHFTSLEGIMEKENPEVYDYVVEEKLKKLYEARDFGPYADQDGTMHVAFVARNHTTGGNSGSPVLNANGELVGVNFDRCWEGTMSDLIYDPNVCRNISIDIRYFLFIVDKFAGAGHLIEEMTLVD